MFFETKINPYHLFEAEYLSVLPVFIWRVILEYDFKMYLYFFSLTLDSATCLHD